eukprot:1759973-Pyramimonas_sp.AAC.1
MGMEGAMALANSLKDVPSNGSLGTLHLARNSLCKVYSDGKGEKHSSDGIRAIAEALRSFKGSLGTLNLS